MKNLDKLGKEFEQIWDVVAKETNVEYIQQHEDEDGGTLIFRSDNYSIMVDYDITGGYDYHLATTKYDNEGIMETEEYNQKYVKTPKAVISYIKRFDK